MSQIDGAMSDSNSQLSGRLDVFIVFSYVTAQMAVTYVVVEYLTVATMTMYYATVPCGVV